MDYLPLHQVDVTELVESLAGNGPTLVGTSVAIARENFLPRDTNLIRVSIVADELRREYVAG